MMVLHVTSALEDSLPVFAILIVVISMMYVHVSIMGDALRALTVIPILVVLLLWAAAIRRTRRKA